MPVSQTARALAIAAVAIAIAQPSRADQTMQMGISVSARNIAVDGNSVVLSGDVRIAAAPDRHLVLKSEKRGLLVQFSDNQNRTVTISPFDVKSETVSINADGIIFTDRRGSTVTILTSGQLPEAPTAPTPAASMPLPVAPTTPQASAPPPSTPASVPVTIVQTPSAPAEPSPKKPRYVDPVTDRGAVIP